MSLFDVRTAYLPAQMDWPTWSKMFLDVDVWRPVVERICRATAVADPQMVEAGYPGTCAVFVVDEQGIDGKYIVKLYPPMLPADFAKERAVYRLLDGQLPELPRLLAEGVYPDQLDWPFLMVEFCAGEPIRELYGQIDEQNVLQLGRHVGRMIRTIHDAPLDGTLPFDTRVSAWQAFLAKRQQACMAELNAETQLSATLIAEIRTFLADIAPTLVPDNAGLHLIHADLTEDHLLLLQDDDQWRVSALIDWADAEVGTLEYEWVSLWFGLCNRNSAFFHATLNAYDPTLRVDAEFRRRMLAYTLLHRFGPSIIEHVWRADEQPMIETLAALQEWLWPV